MPPGLLESREQNVFLLSRPDDAAVQDFLRRQSSLEFSYSEIGATASGAGPPSSEYRWDAVRVSLSCGQERFTSAIAAFRSWRQFDVGWAEAVPSNTSIETGQIVAVRARIAGVWSLHACRIVYVIDEPGPISRFGFGYGTLPGHAEAGEERFLIEWDQSTDEVTYEVSAFFRPRHPLVRLGWPVGIWLVNRFRRDSTEAMRRAVRTGGTPGCEGLIEPSPHAR